MKRFILAAFLFSTQFSFAQLIVEPLSDSLTPKIIVNTYFKGKNIEIKNVKFIGDIQSMGLFTDSLNKVSFKNGFILCTGLVDQVIGPNGRPNAGANLGNHFFRDPSLITSSPTCDGVSVIIDFIPKFDSIGFNFAFGSEEYPEFVGKDFNDGFGLFLKQLDSNEPETETNLATLPNGQIIQINSINQSANPKLFINNNNHLSPLYEYLEYDGITRSLHAGAKVIPGQTYQLKLVIADIGDCEYDSGLFIENGSFSSTPTKKVKKSTKQSNSILDTTATLLFFRTNQTLLTPKQFQKAIHIVDSVAQMSFDSIVIRGFHDEQMESKEIGLKRAYTVKSLLKTYKVKTQTYKTYQKESAQLLPNKSSKNRALHKRVEIKFYPSN